MLDKLVDRDSFMVRKRILKPHIFDAKAILLHSTKKKWIADKKRVIIVGINQIKIVCFL
jgi:hypothetical protein